MLEFLQLLWNTTAPALIAVKQTLDAIIETIPYFKIIATMSSICAAICFIFKITPKIPNWIKCLRTKV